MKVETKLTLRRMGKAVVALALASVLMPTTALGEPVQEPTPITLPTGEVRVNGTIPVDKQVYHVPDSTTELYAQSSNPLPSRYRSDEQPWATGIKVKNQGITGLCWAFATTSASEYSYAKETYGQLGAVSETSPAHLGYFLYNRVNDPLGNTAYDANMVPSGSEGWPLYGGNQIYAMQHLASYSGLGLESKTPISVVDDHIYYDSLSDQNIWDGTYPLFDDSLAYDDYTTIQESIYYSPGNEDLDTVIDTVKRMVYDHGAVSASVEFDFYNFQEERYISGQTFKYGLSYYNYNDEAQNDHAVTIIGWDDSYAASNFTHTRDIFGGSLQILVNGRTTTLTDSQASAKTTPPGDGAWIVQNSWGTGVHDDGIYYLSYYSADVNADGTFYAYDMQDANTYQFNFQYDGTAGCDDASDHGNEDYLTVAGTAAANIYTNTTGVPITLEAVGFTTYNMGETNYDISVYTALADPSDPTSGILAGTTHTSTVTAGVKTAVLDTPVVIGAGETYSIVFSFPDELARFGVEKYGASIYINDAHIEPGQSFFRAANSETWEDMKNHGACYRIKGLANPVDTAHARFTVTFVDGLGHTLNTQSVAYGSSAVAPNDPTLKGFLFAGWDVSFSRITSNLIVTATWVVDPHAQAEWERLAGSNRYETMEAIVQAGFNTSDWVVIATGTNYPDALMASSLAGLKNCPVILTKGTAPELGKAAKQTIEDLKARYAYVVGGTGVVSMGIENQLTSMGIEVTRVAGANRQETSVMALGVVALRSEPDTVVIATGWGFADALSIGPWCYKHVAPILLAKNGKLSTQQVEVVQSLTSIKNVVIVGGTAAVSDEVKDQLGNGYTYERLAGNNRYATSVAIAEWELEERSVNTGNGSYLMQPGMSLEHVAVATGKDYPDALAGAALCGQNDSVLLLVAPGEKNTKPALDFLEDHPDSVSVGYVLGGTSAVPESIVELLEEATL